jgi:hypothetical protein
MANWSLPTLTSTYTNFLTEVTGRDTDVALGLDPANTTVTNPPTNAIRWNSANNRWEKFNGTTWGTLSATYAFTAITTTGNASVGGTLSVTGATTLAAATATTPLPGAVSTEVVTAAWVNNKAFAPLASPALTGTPTAPTAAVNTSTTQVATTAFVLGQANSTAATVAMNGTQAAGTSTLWARADHVHPTDTSRAPLASPTFTGTPAAPTAAADTNTTQVATTAFVVGQASSTSPAMNGTATVGTSLRYARADHIHPTDTSRAPAASPSFTGTASFAGDINMTGTGYLELPSGTTAQRPGSPSAGMIRYNSTLNQFEGYGTDWGALISVNSGPIAGTRNRIINGSMMIDQRNAGAAQTITAGAALAYTVDRWYAYCTGANVTGQRVAGATNGQFRYQFAGLGGAVSGVGFAQRVESANSADLAGTTATLSADLASSQLTTVAWTAYYANSFEAFGSIASPTKTQIATGSWTVSSTITRYSAQISIPAAATTGIEIVLSVGALTTGTWTIGDVQLEAGTVATPFERRSYGLELALCQRYFQQLGGGMVGFEEGNTTHSYGLRFMQPMRTAPTFSLISSSYTYRYINPGVGDRTISISINGATTITTQAAWLYLNDLSTGSVAGRGAIERNGGNYINASSEL